MSNKKADTMFSLERKGDMQDEPKPPFVDTPTDADKIIYPQDVAAENAALKAENEALKQRLDDELASIRAQLSGMAAKASEGEEKPAAVSAPKLDLERPYAKTRTSGGGVFFTQDGRKFNARGVLMADDNQ